VLFELLKGSLGLLVKRRWLLTRQGRRYRITGADLAARRLARLGFVGLGWRTGAGIAVAFFSSCS
jgi:hypothetical protein